MELKVRIVNKSGNPLPQYKTEMSAGMDLMAFLNKDVLLKAHERILIPTGIFIELPKGYEAQIRPRSGLALKNGISIVNSPGTIDADYRGEIGVILLNTSSEDFTIKNGDRICQMIIAKHETALWDVVDILDETERGEGGFGHTGKN